MHLTVYIDGVNETIETCKIYRTSVPRIYFVMLQNQTNSIGASKDVEENGLHADGEKKLNLKS